MEQLDARAANDVGMTSTRFVVHYDGPVLQTHEIDVKKLAPSLIALSDAFDAIQKKIAPGASLTLKARATQEGSFVIDLMMYLQLAEDLFNSPAATAMINAAELGEVMIGGIKMIKECAEHQGAEPGISKADNHSSDSTTMQITYPDGKTVAFSEAALEMFHNPDFVKNVKTFIEPARTDGVDSVELESDKDRVSVNENEADGIFEYCRTDETEANTSVEKLHIQALDISFRKNGKWRITDGFRKHMVSIEDKAFLERVASNQESFRGRDEFDVLMRVQTTSDDNGQMVKKYLAIEKVLEHKSTQPPKQDPLF